MTEPTPWVTACVPTFRCAGFLRHAVTSLLAQTYPYVRVVVVNDGDATPPWSVLTDIADPRLVRFDLDENRGPYFALAVALEATPDSLFLVQDADDWSAPHRVATLLRLLRGASSNYAFSTVARFSDHDPRGARVLSSLFCAGPDVSDLGEFRNRMPHHGLFQTAALRRLGGYFGGFRFGYDTLVTSFLCLTGTVSWTPESLYWRRMRPTSLSSSAETGLRSPRRQLALADMQAMYRTVFDDYEDFVARRITGHELLRRIRWYVGTRRGAADTARIRDAAVRLRRHMSRPAPRDGGGQ